MVTSKLVQRILGIPAGDLLMDDKNWSKEYYDFWKVLKDKGYDVVSRVKFKGKMQENKKNPLLSVIAVHKSVKDKHEQAHAFFCIVLCKLLLPTASNVPTVQHVGMCSYIDSMKKYNWCIYVCQDLKNKITAWKKKGKNTIKIQGCGLLLLVSEDL